MGVSSCTGPSERKELHAVMLEIDEGESVADSSKKHVVMQLGSPHTQNL